jgi:signal transduction histidine kinase
VATLFEDGDGGIWASSIPGGLDRFEPVTRSFRRLACEVDDPVEDPFPRSVYALHQTGDGKLWLGTYSSGLVRLDRDTGRCAVYSRMSGLPGNWVLSILEDDRGRLWLGTGHGLACFDPATGTSRNFDASHGLQDVQFEPAAAWRGNGGELFFGGMDGLNSFFPDSLKPNPHAPPVVIVSLDVHDGTGSMRRIEGIEALDRIDLDYRDNFLTVQFTALDFANPSRNRYAYRLEGLDAGWIDSGTRRLATYTDLDPGRYTLRVKGANQDGVWNETGASLLVVIEPPFWRTRSFLAACGLLAAAGVWGLHRSRVRSARNRALELERVRHAENERVRKEAARDFHDELGHLVTKISLFGEILKRRSGPGAGGPDYADKIVSTSKRLTQGMGDFIWTLDPDRNSLRDVAVRLKDFGDDLFDKTNVDFRATGIGPGLDEVRLPVSWRRHLILMFKEAMHNTLKHAGGSKVDLEFRVGEGEVTVSLIDDGLGFDPDRRGAEGQGLESMQARAHKLRGEFRIESSPGVGTALRFTGRPERNGGGTE